jgi:predicted MPP superfamily phosphohydrolase
MFCTFWLRMKGGVMVSSMPVSEKIVLLVFLACFVAVYVTAGGILVRRVFLKLRGKSPAQSRYRRWTTRVVFVLGAIGLLCMLYGYFVEPSWLEVNHVRISSTKLPPGTPPIRIAHISDLHCESEQRLESKLPEIIAEFGPDAIAFTGDAANTREGFPNFRECMKRLSAIAPTFAVRGNWDSYLGVGRGTYEGTNVRLLNEEHAELQIGDVTICIAGVSVGGQDRVESVLKLLPPDAFRILLSHYPGVIDQAANCETDLTLAGHTHGGQIALPFYGAIVTLTKYGKRYEAGLYRRGQTHLYVNRGLGLEGAIAPRVRFFARPEVTLIEISPSP